MNRALSVIGRPNEKSSPSHIIQIISPGQAYSLSPNPTQSTLLTLARRPYWPFMARNRMGLANQNHVTCPILLAMRVRVGVSSCFWIDRGFAAGHK